MDTLKFEWDSGKDKRNLKKHGVSFNEARSAFYDEYAIQFSDPDHSGTEDRFILPGVSHILNVLVVCHFFRKEETVTRIISARKADVEEQRVYRRNRI